MVDTLSPLALTSLGTAFGLAALVAVYALVTGVGPVPTSARARRALMDLMPEELDGPILELGAGWGTLAVALARRFPNAPVIAVECSPVPWAMLLMRVWLTGLPNLHVQRGNFFQVSLEQAALAVCYLYPGAMTRLRPKFEAELRPGALVVSNAFAVPGWRPDVMKIVNGLFPGRIYLYSV